MIWRVTCKIGVYWDGPEYLIGFYRWKWRAFLAARTHLMIYPYRECFIVPVHRYESWKEK